MNFAIRVKGSKIEHIISADNIVNALNKFLSLMEKNNELVEEVNRLKEKFGEE